MRISDWSSDVCSSDLGDEAVHAPRPRSREPDREAVQPHPGHRAGSRRRGGGVSQGSEKKSDRASPADQPDLGKRREGGGTGLWPAVADRLENRKINMEIAPARSIRACKGRWI